MRIAISSSTVLSVPAFRRVWVGATVSYAGDAASWVALVALALRISGASLLVVVVLYTAPVAIGGLLAGWALDRFDRRRVMMADNLVRGAAFASIPLSLASGHLAVALLYAVASMYGLMKMVSLAGFPSLIPTLVPDGCLDQANALEGASYGLASLAGAGLAGLAVATVGPAWVIAFDSASYGVMALCLWSVPSITTARSIRHPRPAGQRVNLRAVVRLVAATPVLRDTTAMFTLFNIGDGALLVFLPHRSLQLGLGAGGYGYLVAATTGGELLAAVALVKGTWSHPLALSIVLAQAAAAAVTLLLVVHTVPTAVVALFVLGVCSAPMTAWAQSLRMRLVDPELHGRLFALLRTTMQATPPLGAILAGFTLRWGSTLTVLVVVGAMGLPALLVGPHLLRRARGGADEASNLSS